MRLFGFSYKTVLAAGTALVVLFAALWLDLENEGMAWDVLWNVTGEREPAAQLLGASQYLATYTRPAPRIASNADIQHLPENPFGVNTFLQTEAEPQKREQQMQMVAEAGFGWIRQEFPWEDIEIHGRGDFTDSRNDLDGDGKPDTISAWDKYDHIVNLANQYEVEIIARLSAPPTWSQPPGTTNPYTPPADFQDFANFAAAVAERYKGSIHYYQIWNEPNIYPEWGDQQIDPAGYTDLLCRTYQVLKEIDPEIVVLSAAIGPTVDLSGRDAYDLLYLQRLYDFGAGDCFDILSAQGYGLFSGPTDRRMRPTVMNFGRHQWLRDIMVANGDAEKPIWISEAGWNPVPPLPGIWGYDTYGTVSMAEAADYVPIAYERALSEWPYVGVINYWFLKRHDDSERLQSWYYFRLLEPDFTPTPIYESFKTTIQGGEWRKWRDPRTSWEYQARERVPQVLILGLGILFAAYVLARALIERLLRAST